MLPSVLLPIPTWIHHIFCKLHPLLLLLLLLLPVFTPTKQKRKKKENKPISKDYKYIYTEREREREKVHVCFCVPVEIQERKIGGEECGIWSPGNWVGGRDFWRRNTRRKTVPETAMAVARTTPWGLIIEDMASEKKPAKLKRKSTYELDDVKCEKGGCYNIYTE